jgi:myo-inositol-1(or 4)-monophosphatase
VEILPEELQSLCILADQAGRVIYDWFGKTHATRKADGTLATEADLAAEEVILEGLAHLYPNDAVCSEESYSISRVGQGRLWSVDPLDGTHNYAAGLAVWSVSLGLIEGGRPVLGVVHSPPLGLTFAAAAGLGVWCNGERLNPPPADPLQRNDLVGDTVEPEGLCLNLPHKRRNLGSAALHGCWVMSGVFRAALFSHWVLWDLAAVFAMAAELQIEARWLSGELLSELSTLESAKRQDYLLLAPPGLCGSLASSSGFVKK